MINWYYGKAVLLSTVTSTNPGSKLLYQATVTDRGVFATIFHIYALPMSSSRFPLASRMFNSHCFFSVNLRSVTGANCQPKCALLNGGGTCVFLILAFVSILI